MDVVALACGGSRVEIVPALGGKIASLFVGGREWLWTSDTLPRVAPADDVAADDAASYVRTADTGGYDECVPTVAACRVPDDVPVYGGVALPDHGELWSQYATTDRLGDDASGYSAITRWTGRRMPYDVARTVRVSESGTVYMDYALTNRGGVPMPFLWSAHPLLPLADDTTLDLPAGARVRVWAQHGVDLGGEGAEHAWPTLRAFGEPVDFTRPAAVRDAGWACKLFVDLAAAPTVDGRVPLGVTQDGARLTVSVDPREVPHFGLWINERGWTPFEGGVPYRNLAFEPCIGAPDSLSAALGAWRSAASLEAGETRRWTLEWSAG